MRSESESCVAASERWGRRRRRIGARCSDDANFELAEMRCDELVRRLRDGSAVAAIAAAARLVARRQCRRTEELARTRRRFSTMCALRPLLWRALPSSHLCLQPSATDSMAIGVAKRFHLLIGVGALSAELIAVLVSSITLTRLGMEGKTSCRRQCDGLSLRTLRTGTPCN